MTPYQLLFRRVIGSGNTIRERCSARFGMWPGQLRSGVLFASIARCSTGRVEPLRIEPDNSLITEILERFLATLSTVGVVGGPTRT